MRTIVFVSHANPEDNEFTLWLALQLAREGYRVWSDLTRLLGGEDFWADIEAVIRTDACKFLYVLSRNSNRKPGPLNELSVAIAVAKIERLHDFIIPLHIDDLPHTDTNIELRRLNAAPFERGWAPGLRDLLKKLEEDAVPRSPSFSPLAVASWWRTAYSADRGVLEEPEQHLSNWFSIRDLPTELQFHELHRATPGPFDLPSDFPYPAFAFDRYVISFASSADLAPAIHPPYRLGESRALPVDDAERLRAITRAYDTRQLRDFVVRLLAMAWDGTMSPKGLPAYPLANGRNCFYFTKGAVPDDTIQFESGKEKPASRSVVGYRTVHGEKRFWQFGFSAEARLHPTPVFAIRSHVLFSDEGTTPWENKDRLHRSRRRWLRGWWNDTWRDRLLATMTWLAEHSGSVRVPLGSGVAARVDSCPLLFRSPVSYIEPPPARRRPTKNVDAPLDSSSPLSVDDEEPDDEYEDDEVEDEDVEDEDVEDEDEQ